MVCQTPSAPLSALSANQMASQATHCVAQVRFPTPCEWHWYADQAPFARQPLGTISVAPAMTETQPAGTTDAQVLPTVRLSLPIGTVLARAAFVWRPLLIITERRSRSPVASRQARGRRSLLCPLSYAGVPWATLAVPKASPVEERDPNIRHGS